MMGLEMSLMMILMLVGALVLLAAVGAAAYLGLRAARRRDGELEQGGSAREVLARRLASGELSPEEYYERESALRDAHPPRGRR